MAEVRVDQLLARIKQGKPIAAIVLLGADSYLRDMSREKLIAAHVPEGMRDWAHHPFSASDTEWGAVLERAQTLPMLAPHQVIVISDAEAWQEMSGDSLEAFKSYLDDPAPFSLLVFEAVELDRRRSFYKCLAEKALLVDLHVDPDAAAELAAGIAKELGAEIGGDGAALLVDISNGDLSRVRIELEKLAAYAAGRKITTADIEALVIAAKKYSVWQLADMLAEQRRDAAFNFLDSLLRESEQPIAIIGALAWMYRKLLEARELPAGTAGWQAARTLGMPGERAELALRRARKIPQAQLIAGIEALAVADNRLRSGIKEDRTVMELLVARLTAGVPSRAA